MTDEKTNQKPYTEELMELRTQIDQIDTQIIQLLAARMEVVLEVGGIKAQYGLPALAPDRWATILLTRKEQAENLGLDVGLVEEIYTTIHDHALILEEEQK